MRVIQLLPTFAIRDAIGNETIRFDCVLRDNGYESLIIAQTVINGGEHIVEKKHLSMEDFAPDDVVLFHFSTESELSGLFSRLNCRKALIFHNVTPPKYFEPYDKWMARNCRLGLQQIRYLSSRVDYCIADSEWNKADLRSMGYTCPIDVVPVPVPFEEYRAASPSKKVLDRFADCRGTNMLFVGRVAPNKRIEDVIAAFAAYKRFYDSNAKLFLVGTYRHGDPYHASLMAYVDKLHLTDVFFTGSVSFDELVAYYRLSDVFLCQSEHEGFCVPLVEAMIFGKPVVAYSSTAISETLGGGGVVTDSKDPILSAALVDRLMKDDGFRQTVLLKQEDRLSELEGTNAVDAFSARISGILRKVKNER